MSKRVIKRRTTYSQKSVESKLFCSKTNKTLKKVIIQRKEKPKIFKIEKVYQCKEQRYKVSDSFIVDPANNVLISKLFDISKKMSEFSKSKYLI